MAELADPDPITASEDYTRFRSSIPQRKVGIDPGEAASLSHQLKVSSATFSIVSHLGWTKVSD